LAKEAGLAGELEILTVYTLVLVRASPLSGEYWPGPIVSTILSVLFSPIVNVFTPLSKP